MVAQTIRGEQRWPGIETHCQLILGAITDKVMVSFDVVISMPVDRETEFLELAVKPRN